MLGRDTEWRQGSVLAESDAVTLGLVEAEESSKRVVVITHDCDLPHAAEVNVEVIVGSIVAQADPMYIGARNPRKLHLRYIAPSGNEVCLEISHSDLQVVPKSNFTQIGNPDGGMPLDSGEKRALKQWLAARYGRPAFPNELETRLRKRFGKKTVVDRIAHTIEPDSTHLVGLFFDLGEERTAELTEEEPYFLSIFVVYDASEGGQAAREAAERVATALTKLFHEAYGAPEASKEIALEKCDAVADTYLTLADLRKVDQWRVEYISLRKEPAGDFIAVGDMPA